MSRLVGIDDSVLVVIDTQPGFLKEIDDAWADDVVGRIRWLVRLARAVGVPLVVTEEEAPRNGETASPVLEVLAEGQVRHDKDAFGLVACPPIVADLERHGRGTAVLCGTETDVCVSQSALGLLDAGWRVVVIEDAVASPRPGHEQGLDRMRDAGVEVLGLKTLAYEWLRRVDRLDVLREVLGGEAPPGVTL
ncbi:MAG TPA: isochorismatase family protein [Actinomycetota bacterium]